MSESTAWPRAVLFDLDGTLIDSAPDIAACTNILLAQDGHPPLTVDQVRTMIGNGVGKLVERAYRASGAPLLGRALDDAIARMMPIYADNLFGETIILPGAVEAMRDLAQSGVAVAVVSNKPAPFTAEICAHYGFQPYLAGVQGAEDHLPKKPAPDMLLAAMAKCGATAGDTLMVGDSGTDVQAARNAGLPVVVVRGGYGQHAGADELGADAVIDTLHDLTAAVEKLAAQR